MTDEQPHRIGVVGTGTVGAHAARAILWRPDLDLVGAKVYTDAKVGVDVGELLGEPPVGVGASGTLAELVDLGPECIVYAPNAPDLQDIVYLLEAGVDVITTAGGYLFYPYGDSELTATLTRACEAGGSSFHGAGVNPGFMSARFPLVLTSWCRRIERVRVSECAVMVDYPSPQTLFDLMHFGQPLDPANCEKGSVGQRIRKAFEAMVAETVAGLGAELQEIRQSYEEAPAPRTLHVAAGTVEEGTVAGQRWRWSGIVDGRPLVELETNWVLADDLEGFPKEFGWHVEVDGDPGLRATLNTHGGLNHDDECCIATAMQAVNAIGAVRAAAPGVRTYLDLPAVHGQYIPTAP